MSISIPESSEFVAERQPPCRVVPSSSIYQLLQQHWGYSQFRPGQLEIVAAQLQGRDLLAVLPTGSGKSLCFQLPALCRPGLTLVVSPLIALMEDQVAGLKRKNIAAASLHSQQSSRQRRQILRGLAHLKLLYLSPETLLSQPVWQMLQQPGLAIAGLILDEAHCLTQWGESFRPVYSRLGAVRRGLLAAKSAGTPLPVAAFTATADHATRATICDGLELEDPALFVRSPYRPNIELQFQRVWTPRQRRQKALAFIRHQADPAYNRVPVRIPVQTPPSAMPSGLVYVRRRRDSESLAKQFVAAGLKTAAYHGGLSSRRRRAIEQAWLQGGAVQNGLPFVVCTSAFGMGVDLPSCRWILHYHLPLLLAEYVQEIGRAGRDGKAATALALVSEPSGWLDPSDRQRDRAFLQALSAQQRRCWAIAQHLPTTGTCEQVQKQHPEGLMALALLHRQGYLRWLDPFQYCLKQIKKCPSALETRTASDASAMKCLKSSKTEPWEVIEAAFS